MPTLGGKRAHISTEAALKRQRVDGSDSEYSAYVPSDQEDFSNNECESDHEFDPNTFTKDDFHGIDIDVITLNKFTAAYQEFLHDLVENSAAEASGKEPMLLEKPNNLRPVPTTVEQFKTRMPIFYLSEQALEQKNDLEQQILQVHEREEAIDEENEVSQARDEESILAQINVFIKMLENIELLYVDGLYKEVLENLLVVTDVLFDQNIHLIFSLNSPIDAVDALLEVIGQAWQKILRRPCEELETSEFLRAAIRRFLAGCIKDLNAGVFIASHENPFSKSRFEFESMA